MRILFVSGLTSYGAGGAQTETIKLVRGISAFVDKAAISIDNPLNIPDIEHFHLDYPPTNDAPAQVRAAIEAFKPDVVHVVGGGIRLLWQINLLAPPLPWIFTSHNIPPCERIFPGLYGRNDLYYLARDAIALPSTLMWKHFLRSGSFRSVISHSDAVSVRLRSYGCPAGKIRQIPFGFDTPKYLGNGISPFPADAFPRLLTVAGLIHHKGLHDIVRIMPTIQRRFKNAHYCIIGERRDHNYADFLERQILKANLGECIRLVGNASDTTKAAALRDADLYVQPSHEEGFCIAFSEAAAVVPRLVGTATGEMPGLSRDDPTAMIVAPGQPAELVDAMMKLIGTAVERDAVLSRQEKLRRCYPWKSYFDQHLAAYAD
jgi:glycosyltransferase involved in cell wall biosynthesis